MTPSVGLGLLLALWSLRVSAGWQMVLVTLVAGLLLLLTLLDLEYRLVPNLLVFPAAAAILLAAAVTPFGLANSLLGGALGFALFAVVAFLRPGGLGGGDVKLAGLIGLGLGPYALWAFLVGVLAGGGAVVYLAARRRYQASATMPYAPFLCLGTLVALWYNPVTALYEPYAWQILATRL